MMFIAVPQRDLEFATRFESYLASETAAGLFTFRVVV